MFGARWIYSVLITAHCGGKTPERTEFEVESQGLNLDDEKN
jgi:hypothetical protein